MTDHHGDDAERLGEVMRRAVPEGPAPAGRADEVVRRARRNTRRRGAVSVAAVGAVALAVVAGPSLSDSVSRTSDIASPTNRPLDTSAAAAALDDPVVCPTAGSAVAWLSKETDRSVPGGAVLARICPAHPGRDAGWSPPIEALTTNVASVIAAFNALPPATPADFVCAIQTGRTSAFTVTFQYPDGRVVALDGYTGTCNGVRISGGPGLGRFGAGELLATFVARLQSQRATDVPPATASSQSLECPSKRDLPVNGLLPGPRRLDLQKAIVCTYLPPNGPQPHSITASEVEAMNADYPSHVYAFEGVCDRSFVPAVIIGVTTWGDTVSLARGGCDAWSRKGRIWTPGHAAQQAIEAARRR